VRPGWPLRPGWEIWQYRDDLHEVPLQRLAIAFDGKVVHRFVFDDLSACTEDMRSVILGDIWDALKEHGAVKERDDHA
jgi:hypothetical protein